MQECLPLRKPHAPPRLPGVQVADLLLRIRVLNKTWRDLVDRCVEMGWYVRANMYIYVCMHVPGFDSIGVRFIHPVRGETLVYTMMRLRSIRSLRLAHIKPQPHNISTASSSAATPQTPQRPPSHPTLPTTPAAHHQRTPSSERLCISASPSARAAACSSPHPPSREKTDILLWTGVRLQLKEG